MMGDDSGLKLKFRRKFGSVVFFAFKALVLFSFCVPKLVNATNPCTDAQFWVVNADNKSSCVDCESCHPGYGLSHKCGQQISSNAMVTCVPCQEGSTFSSNYDTSMCHPCGGSCSEDQVVLQDCTRTKDVKCAKQCYSKNKYYDEFNSCSPCSRCCGDDQDVMKDECKRKLQGVTSDMVCSFHSSVNRCDITTTASPPTTTTIISTSSLARTSSSVPRQNPGTLTSVVSSSKDDTTSATVTLENTDTITPAGQSNPKDYFKLPHVVVAVIIIVPIVLVLGAVIFCVYKRRRLHSCCHGHDVEREVKYSVKDAHATVAESKGKVLSTCIHAYKSSKVKLEATRRDSREPLLTTCIKDPTTMRCSCQMDTKKVLTPLKMLKTISLDAYESVWKRLDKKLEGTKKGDFRDVAIQFNYKEEDIWELEKEFIIPGSGSPSRQLLECLETKKPELTVLDFITVLQKPSIDRDDIVDILKEYIYM